MTALQATDIDQQFLLSLAALQQVQAALNLPLLPLLSFWSDLDTDGRDSLYLSLFQNKAVLNPPDSAFQLQYSAQLSALPTLQFPSPLFPNLTYDPTTTNLSLNTAMSDDEYTERLGPSTHSSFTAAVNFLRKGSFHKWNRVCLLDSLCAPESPEQLYCLPGSIMIPPIIYRFHGRDARRLS